MPTQHTNAAKLADLCIIIPTLNAEACLPDTLTALGNAADIVVVDGGSTDRTAAIATTHGAGVRSASRGRGSQIAAGIAATDHPWLLLLHADTSPESNWRTIAAVHMAGDTTRAGYFRFSLDSANPKARRLERAVAWRSRFLGLPYGDQGLLIHRDLLRAAGGMRPLPLMEDVDLARRIGRSRLVALPAKAVTSATRWERDGYLRRSARNLFCLSLWIVGVPPRWILRIYQWRQ